MSNREPKRFIYMPDVHKEKINTEIAMMTKSTKQADVAVHYTHK